MFQLFALASASHNGERCGRNLLLDFCKGFQDTLDVVQGFKASDTYKIGFQFFALFETRVVKFNDVGYCDIRQVVFVENFAQKTRKYNICIGFQKEMLYKTSMLFKKSLTATTVVC